MGLAPLLSSGEFLMSKLVSQRKAFSRRHLVIKDFVCSVIKFKPLGCLFSADDVDLKLKYNRNKRKTQIWLSDQQVSGSWVKGDSNTQSTGSAKITETTNILSSASDKRDFKTVDISCKSEGLLV